MENPDLSRALNNPFGAKNRRIGPLGWENAWLLQGTWRSFAARWGRKTNKKSILKAGTFCLPLKSSKPTKADSILNKLNKKNMIDRWLWVKNRSTPKWLALVNGTKDSNLRSISWLLHFDPDPDKSTVGDPLPAPKTQKSKSFAASSRRCFTSSALLRSTRTAALSPSSISLRAPTARAWRWIRLFPLQSSGSLSFSSGLVFLQWFGLSPASRMGFFREFCFLCFSVVAGNDRSAKKVSFTCGFNAEHPKDVNRKVRA